jgi:DNA-binding transcriptional LysR family regulator
MDLSSRDIGYFLSVVNAGSLVGAAGERHVTEAALSKAIRRIESSVGLPLFERSKKGMVPTPAGRVMHEHAVRIRREHDDAMSHAADLRSGAAGTLRLGVTRPVFDSHLAAAIAHLLRRQPGLQLRVVLETARLLLDRLALGELDLVFAPLLHLPRKPLEARKFATDALIVLAREGHPAAAKRPRRLADLAAYPWILPPKGTSATTWFDQCFTRAGLAPPAASIELDYASRSALQLIATTEFLLLSPGGWSSAGSPPGVRRLRVSALDVQRPLYVVSRRGAYASRAMRELVAHL